VFVGAAAVAAVSIGDLSEAVSTISLKLIESPTSGYTATPTSDALVWGGGSDIPVPGDMVHPFAVRVGDAICCQFFASCRITRDSRQGHNPIRSERTFLGQIAGDERSEVHVAETDVLRPTGRNKSWNKYGENRRPYLSTKRFQLMLQLGASANAAFQLEILAVPQERDRGTDAQDVQRSFWKPKPSCRRLNSQVAR
jgi:hypothetical protein